MTEDLSRCVWENVYVNPRINLFKVLFFDIVFLGNTFG